MLRTLARLALTGSLLLGLVAGLQLPAHAAPQRETAFGYGDTEWTYRIVKPGALPNFTDGFYDDDNFTQGTAGFGTPIKDDCAYNDPSRVATRWIAGRDLLLRHTLYLPGAPETPGFLSQVRLRGTVDGTAQVYYDGVLLGTFTGRKCKPTVIKLDLPDEAGFHELEVRASDSRGGTFFDARVGFVIDFD